MFSNKENLPKVAKTPFAPVKKRIPLQSKNRNHNQLSKPIKGLSSHRNGTTSSAGTSTTSSRLAKNSRAASDDEVECIPVYKEEVFQPLDYEPFTAKELNNIKELKPNTVKIPVFSEIDTQAEYEIYFSDGESGSSRTGEDASSEVNETIKDFRPNFMKPTFVSGGEESKKVNDGLNLVDLKRCIE